MMVTRAFIGGFVVGACCALLFALALMVTQQQ